MQGELEQAIPGQVRILGVNLMSAQTGIEGMTTGRTIPLLQDVPSEMVWALWNVTYRDVVVLDRNNVVYAVYNLTDHDLSDPANYAEFHDLLVAAAAQ